MSWGLMTEPTDTRIVGEKSAIMLLPYILCVTTFKGMEHVPNVCMSFDKDLFLEVINILI